MYYFKYFFQRYSEFTKYFEVPPADQWGGISGNGFSTAPTALWRQLRNPKPIVAAQYYPVDEIYTYNENWREHGTETGVGDTAITTPHGTISLRLHNKIRVDMTIDRAVRVINFKVSYLSLSFRPSAHIKEWT